MPDDKNSGDEELYCPTCGAGAEMYTMPLSPAISSGGGLVKSGPVLRPARQEEDLVIK